MRTVIKIKGKGKVWTPRAGEGYYSVYEVLECLIRRGRKQGGRKKYQSDRGGEGHYRMEAVLQGQRRSGRIQVRN